MRIGIIGAGALGGTFAALLENSGHEIQVAAREPARNAILKHGIQLSGGYGELITHPDAVHLLTGGFDLVLLCTKAHDAAQALADNAQVIAGTPTVVVQNGLDGVTHAAAMLPRSEVYGALSMIAANYLKPGVVRVTKPQISYLGRGTGAAEISTHRLAETLSDATPFHALDNFRGAQWTKLLVNMVNAVPAILNRSVQEVVRHEPTCRIVAMSMRETVRTGHARGVSFAELQGISEGQLKLFLTEPIQQAMRLPRRIGAAMGAIPNLGSTQQSLNRNRLTEIDFLNGAVVREAAAAGITAPVNQVLTALVHEVEEHGRPFTEPALLAAVNGAVGSAY